MSFYWGNETMSWMRFMTFKSFRILNPEWEMVLYLDNSKKNNSKPWNDSTLQDFFNFNGQDFFNKLQELDIKIKTWDPNSKEGFDLMKHKAGPTQISCLFRWDLLSSEAGFYSDVDVLYVRPIEEYYNQVKNYDTILCYRLGYFSIGFLGSSGNNNAFFRDILKNSFSSFDIREYQTAGVLNNYDWLKKIADIKNKSNNYEIDFWKILEEKYSVKNYNNPMELIYNWHWNQMEEVFLKLHKEIPSNCIGIHWYGGNDISQKFNNFLDSSNYKNYDNTFTYFADKVLKAEKH
jgi:hypothetical protein